MSYSWGQNQQDVGVDKVWRLCKFTDLRGVPVARDGDLTVSVQRLRRQLIVCHESRVLHEISLGSPAPTIRFKDTAVYVAQSVRGQEVKFRFRAFNTLECRQICDAISEFVPVDSAGWSNDSTPGNSQQSFTPDARLPPPGAYSFTAQERIQSGRKELGFDSASLFSQSQSSGHQYPIPTPIKEAVADVSRKQDAGTMTDCMTNVSSMPANELQSVLKYLLEQESFRALVSNIQQNAFAAPYTQEDCVAYSTQFSNCFAQPSQPNDCEILCD